MPRDKFLNSTNGYFIFYNTYKPVDFFLFQWNNSEDVYANKNADGVLKNRSRRGAVGIDAEKDAIYAHVR